MMTYGTFRFSEVVYTVILTTFIFVLYFLTSQMNPKLCHQILFNVAPSFLHDCILWTPLIVL